MTEKEVLGLEPAPRLEQIGDIDSNQTEDREHRIGCCPDSASPRESGRIEFSGTTGVQSGQHADTGSSLRAILSADPVPGCDDQHWGLVRRWR
jgi:hypothetical protein